MVMGYNFFGFFTKYEATLLQEMRKRWPKYHIRRIRGTQRQFHNQTTIEKDISSFVIVIA